MLVKACLEEAKLGSLYNKKTILEELEGT